MKKNYTLDELNDLIKSKKAIVLADVDGTDPVQISSFFNKSKKQMKEDGDIDMEGDLLCGIFAEIGFNYISFEELNHIYVAHKINIK